MTQFLDIINLLSNPTAILSNAEQQRLIQEFERLKESENGWKDCIQILMSDQNMNDQTKFFCMQVVENYLKKRYKTSDSQADQDVLRSFMGFWLQSQMQRKANERNFLTKKAAQLFALVSLIDFPTRWSTFFTDLMQTCQWSVGNADFYLKVLMAIDAEIVDRAIPRSVDEANIVNDYKDAMRIKCVNELVESWHLILKEHSAKNPEITCQCLEVIGQFVSWIEINLIVNERFLEFFSYALRHVDLRETACSCLEEIVNKGMDIRSKLKLVDYLWDNLIRTNAIALEQQIGLLNDEQDNCDYLLKFGKLLNTIGENLFQGWHKKPKEPDLAQLLFKSIEEKLPFALRLLNHQDDDISESVFEFCMHYISMLKVTKVQTQQQQNNIESILTIAIYKMKYDQSFNFDNEGEDEAMFLEYRKSLKQVLDSIAQLDSNFVLITVKNLVLSVANDWRTKSFIDIENALYLLYLITEALPSSQSNHFQTGTVKNDCLCEMMQAIVTSNLVENAHRIVKLQYFENLARYFKFFQIYPALLEPAVGHFIGASGLHSMDPKLRSRVSYLFSRFTKDLRTQLSQYVERILQNIQDLLTFWNPLEFSSSPALLLQKHEQNQGLYDDQLFLYETASLLVVNSSLEPKLKAQLMKNILTPIVSTFLALIQKYCETADEKVRLVYATSVNMAMSVATRVSKGFSNVVKVKDCECTDMFLEILRIFVQAINVNTHKSLIHAGIRQYLHRMIICIDNEVLEYIPVTIEQFLNVSNEPRDIVDLMPLINQVLSKYKQQVTPLMQRVLMQLTNVTLNFVNSLPAQISSDILRISPQQIQNLNVTVPILSAPTAASVAANNNNNMLHFGTSATTAASSGRPSSTTTLRRQLNINSTAVQMNGSSTTTSSIIGSDSSGSNSNTNDEINVNDEMDDIAISPDTQYVLDIQSMYKAYFTFLLNVVNNDLMDVFLNHSSNDIYRVYCALLQGVQIGPPDISKACLQVIKKLISFFVDKPVVENFIPFTIQNLVPCCLQVFTQNIDINDAQQILVLNELGQCLILLYTKFGEEFISYLEQTYLPTLEFGAQISQGLIQIIKANDPKALKDLVLAKKTNLIV